MAARLFGLCLPGALARNGMTSPHSPLSRYNARRGQWVQGRHADDSRRLAFVHCARRGRGPCPAQASDSRRTDAEDIARGKALTEAGDCASCHTADPAKPFAGGKRIDTPFGGIYSPNLTPDRETGLGAWSDDDFYSALRFGVARDGSRYYPAFPYPNFTKLTRQDIFAIRAYLATLTPVSNAPRAPELRFPFNYRFVMRGWNWLFFKPGIPDAGPAEERGVESRPLSGRGRRALRRLPYAEEHLRRRQARPRPLAAVVVAGHVRAAAGRRRAQRPEILERGRHHRISAERPQRQEAMPAN